MPLRLTRSPKNGRLLPLKRGWGRSVAQFGSALSWGDRGRWFKSSRSDHIKTTGYAHTRNPIFLRNRQIKKAAKFKRPFFVDF